MEDHQDLTPAKLIEFTTDLRKKIVLVYYEYTDDEGRPLSSNGTGCFILDGKYVLTCAHNVDKQDPNAKAYIVPYSEGISQAADFYEVIDLKKPVSIVSIDTDVDLAVLKLHEAIPEQDCGIGKISYVDLFPGQKVHCISMVQCLFFSYACGTVFNLNACSPHCHLANLQICGLVPGPGLSGAPIFNSKGRITGVILSGDLFFTFAVPQRSISAFIKKVLPNIANLLE